MYIAAHPDDENNDLLTYLATSRNLNTAYLSLTRGDGGQNLLGTEIRELLGILRTQEMLMSREIDGSKQFFSRANDFGYSKNPEETFTIWDRGALLSDMVWLIRKFQPDVLITRFPHTPFRTHGHHTASAQLAYEAFDVAGDATRFPDQLDEVEAWQPERLLFNTSRAVYANDEAFLKAKKEDLLSIEAGTWLPFLGKSNTEVGADSRSQHKCQGMGTAASRGEDKEYFEHLKGSRPENDIFDGIDLTWNRFPGGKPIAKKLKKIEANFDIERPWLSVPALMEVRELIYDIQNENWSQLKVKEIDNIIYHSLGLFLEVRSSDFSQAPGEKVQLEFEFINRSPINVQLERLIFSGIDLELEEMNKRLPENKVVAFEREGVLTVLSPSRPYWLRKHWEVGQYTIDERSDIGKPENTKNVRVAIVLNIAGKSLIFETPVVYKELDFVKGDYYRPFEVEPPVSINLSEKILVFASDAPKSVTAVLKAGKSNEKGMLRLEVPEGWKTEPTNIHFDFKEKGEEKVVEVNISPGKDEVVGELKVFYGDESAQERIEIVYDHIPTQLLFLDAKTKIVKLNLKKAGERIGYIMGAGDLMPESLRQIGYEVVLLEDAEINLSRLQEFDAVIIGVRAYNTRNRLKFIHPILMEYVKSGGNVITQYTTKNRYSRLVTEELGPYPFEISTDRVTSENATVTILNPDHPLFKGPNVITDKDFENWVQERGLYFPGEWDERYETVIACHDPGEENLESGLLIAKYGDGWFTYTGYSWFRQLPAGVPGAFRIFTNLISLGKDENESQ